MIAVCDAAETRARELAGALGASCEVLGLADLVARCDLVIEAASAAAAPVVLEECLRGAKDLLCLSSAGLLSRPELLNEVRAKGSRLLLPSGGLCALDGVKALAGQKDFQIALTTRKPARALVGAPGLKIAPEKLLEISEETTVFEGNASEAAKAFPQNVNVAATLYLATGGQTEPRVRIIAVPGTRENVHQLEVSGGFGRFSLEVGSFPSPENPKTSQIAILSAEACLREYFDTVRVGT